MYLELGNPKSAVLGTDPSTQSSFRRRVALFLVGTLCALKIVLLGYAFEQYSSENYLSPAEQLCRCCLSQCRPGTPLRQGNFETGDGCNNASTVGSLGSVLCGAHFILLLGYFSLPGDYGAGGAHPCRESRS
eukprot:COSAG02_NODE_1526_length_12092_cov_10.672392_12_plen_132_part_00